MTSSMDRGSTRKIFAFNNFVHTLTVMKFCDRWEEAFTVIRGQPEVISMSSQFSTLRYLPLLCIWVAEVRSRKVQRSCIPGPETRNKIQNQDLITLKYMYCLLLKVCLLTSIASSRIPLSGDHSCTQHIWWFPCKIAFFSGAQIQNCLQGCVSSCNH